MKAVIMAGGEGTRLRPLTCDLPKPMVAFFDKPLVQYTVEHLKSHGISDMVFTLMYRPEKVTDFFGDGCAFGAQVSYSVEETPLGTAGSVKHALRTSDATFLVISGDALTDADLTRAAAYHQSRNAKATLVLKKMENPLEYGIVITDEDGTVVKFVEKPGWREVFSDAVNTGIYLLEPEVLDLIPENKAYDFAKNLFPDMLERGMKLCGYVTEDYWCDIGNIESYIRAHEDVLKGQCRVRLNGSQVNGIWVGENASLSNSALLQAPSYLGAGCAVRDGAKVGMYSCIGRNAEVGEQANVKRSVMWQGAKAGRHAKLSACVVCANTIVGPRSSVYEGAAIGRDCNLEGMNSVAPRARIWPGKWLENGASATENVVWGCGQRRSLFSFRGIAGEFNGSLTAEKLAAAGCAYAAALPRNAKFAVAQDGHPVSEAVLNAFASGLRLSGVNLFSLGETPLPLLRFFMGQSGIEDGAYVRGDAGQKVNIELVDGQTVYAGKAKRKKAQAALEYGDYLRPPKDGVTRVRSAAGAETFYVHGMAGLAGPYTRKPLIALFPGDRKTDRLFIECLKECGMLHTMAEGDPAQRMKTLQADFGVRFHANGEGARLYSPGKAFAGVDAYLSVVYLLALETHKPAVLMLTPGMTQAVRELARMYGVETRECASEEMYRNNGGELNRLLYDPLYFCIRLAAYLCEKGLSLDEFVRPLPAAFASEREIACEWKDIGRVVRMFYEANREGVAVEGVKVVRDHAWGFILPGEDEPKISIRAEGTTEEYARELCDFCTEELKRLLKS